MSNQIITTRIEKSPMVEGRLELLLDEKTWYMKQMNPGQGVREGIPQIPPERDICFSGWNAGFVPGDVYSDLQRAGVIDDPYMGRNLKRLEWVQYHEWWYVCRFNAPDAFEDMNIQLLLEGVVYGCEIWFNGHYLGKHEGMFSPIKFDVTKLVNTYIAEQNSSECDNHLWIKLDPAPQSFYNIAGKHHCFAGDYLPGFVPVGIWRSVKLIGTGNGRVEDLYVEPSLTDTGANLRVESCIEVKRGQVNDHTVQLKVWHEDEVPIVVEKRVPLSPGSNEVYFDVDVENPKLWWPWDMGEQPLYYATMTIYKGDVEIDSKTIRFGIREMKMEMNPGFSLDETEYPWTFVINGKSMFLRSGCWGGPPSLLYGRNSEKKYGHFLKLAKEGNLNNLRIFGWHPPETSEFYDICDELGITVWTNFPLATQVLRDDVEYVNSVLSECREIIIKRRNHPSNIFWMGGEEVYFSQAQVESHNKRMMKQVGKVVAEMTNIPYADASMMSSSPALRLGYKTKETIHANGQYYAAGRQFMEDYFPKFDYPIIPELALASAPCVESLKKFIPANELWPLGPSWGYLMANIDILKTLNVEVFGDQRFDNLEQFVEATQIAQGEIFKYALEVMRRKKPKLSGVAICHFITNRPLIKWDIVDYYGKPKASYYYVKKAFQPVLPSLQYDKRRFMPGETFVSKLWVINDYHRAYENVTCGVEMFDPNGNSQKRVTEVIDISENSAIEYFDFTQEVVGEIGEVFTLTVTLTAENGAVIAENDYTLMVQNQEQAREEIKEFYKVHRGRTLQYGKTLYRDFPESMELE